MLQKDIHTFRSSHMPKPPAAGLYARARKISGDSRILPRGDNPLDGDTGFRARLIDNQSMLGFGELLDLDRRCLCPSSPSSPHRSLTARHQRAFTCLLPWDAIQYCVSTKLLSLPPLWKVKLPVQKGLSTRSYVYVVPSHEYTMLYGIVE